MISSPNVKSLIKSYPPLKKNSEDTPKTVLRNFPVTEIPADGSPRTILKSFARMPGSPQIKFPSLSIDDPNLLQGYLNSSCDNDISQSERKASEYENEHQTNVTNVQSEYENEHQTHTNVQSEVEQGDSSWDADLTNESQQNNGHYLSNLVLDVDIDVDNSDSEYEDDDYSNSVSPFEGSIQNSNIYITSDVISQGANDSLEETFASDSSSLPYVSLHHNDHYAQQDNHSNSIGMRNPNDEDETYEGELEYPVTNQNTDVNSSIPLVGTRHPPPPHPPTPSYQHQHQPEYTPKYYSPTHPSMKKKSSNQASAPVPADGMQQDITSSLLVSSPPPVSTVPHAHTPPFTVLSEDSGSMHLTSSDPNDTIDVHGISNKQSSPENGTASAVVISPPHPSAPPSVPLSAPLSPTSPITVTQKKTYSSSSSSSACNTTNELIQLAYKDAESHPTYIPLRSSIKEARNRISFYGSLESIYFLVNILLFNMFLLVAIVIVIIVYSKFFNSSEIIVL